MVPPPLLELRGVTKRFPGIVANDDVSLTLAAGEVLGVLGENGAGKSTLMNILAGLVVPDTGEVRIDGLVTTPCIAARGGRGGHRDGASALQADRHIDGAGEPGARRPALGIDRHRLWPPRQDARSARA